MPFPLVRKSCLLLAARAKAIVAATVGEECRRLSLFIQQLNFRNRIGSMTLPAFLLAPLSLEALVEPLDSISVDYYWRGAIEAILPTWTLQLERKYYFSLYRKALNRVTRHGKLGRGTPLTESSVSLIKRIKRRMVRMNATSGAEFTSLPVTRRRNSTVGGSYYVITASDTAFIQTSPFR